VFFFFFFFFFFKFINFFFFFFFFFGCFFSLLAVAMYTMMERRFLGGYHLRLGPFIVGPIGYFQPFRDAIKLFVRRDFLLRFNVGFVWIFSPGFALFLYISMVFIFPLGGMGFFWRRSFLFFICLLRVSVYFLVFGGYFSGRRYSLLGRYRSVVQMISYEIVLIFLFIIYFYLFESWNFTDRFFLGGVFSSFYCFPFVLVWLLVILAETNRLPYDFLEGESELVSGFNTEYWGGYFSFLFIYEYGCMVLFCLITRCLLFGSFFSFFMFILFIFSFFWVRATCPRFRYDMLMGFVWRKLLILSLSFFCLFGFL